MNDLKKVYTLASDLNITASRLYRVMDTHLAEQLKDHVFLKANVKHVDQKGQEIIKNYFDGIQSSEKYISISNNTLYNTLESFMFQSKENEIAILDRLEKIEQLLSSKISIEEEIVKEDINVETATLSKIEDETDLKILEMLKNKNTYREINDELKVSNQRIKKIRDTYLNL